jgi:hypothetical protein
MSTVGSARSWVGAQELASIIAGCSEGSVEVFWRTPTSPRAAVSQRSWLEEHSAQLFGG